MVRSARSALTGRLLAHISKSSWEPGERCGHPTSETVYPLQALMGYIFPPSRGPDLVYPRR